MKASLQRPSRVAAAVGGAVAVGAAALMAVLAGTASAATPGVCTDNVNVRAEPKADAKIVAVCDRGTKVQIGEEKDGFVELENLGGWSVKEFVKADAAAPADPNK
ncbi:SH3 domain-containing protein, partial [Pseudonocardia pini]|uniref:SH3 domain-containing protein n=1 Tax=Pseudonocardia pini TaxID=2758030 RepID=UPI0015F09F9F